MSEEDVNSGQSTTGETGTPGTEGQNNNTSAASEGEKTQSTGTPATVPYERFKQVNDELKKYKGSAEPKATQPLQGSDDEWKRKIELEMAVPTFLKEKVSDMTAYWQANPKMSKEDVYKVFTPLDVLVSQAKAADSAAQNSQTGGTSNPAVRSDVDIKNMSDAELEADLQARIARGEKI